MKGDEGLKMQSTDTGRRGDLHGGVADVCRQRHRPMSADNATGEEGYVVTDGSGGAIE